MVSLYLDFVLIVFVSLAAFTDLISRRIPNLLLLTGFCFAIFIHLQSPEPINALLSSMAGTTTGLVVFLPMYCLRGMAAGDVKFMAMVGAFHTPITTLYIALIAVLLGGILSMIVIVFNSNIRIQLSKLIWPCLKVRSSVGSIPYGIAIAGSVWFVILVHYNLILA